VIVNNVGEKIITATDAIVVGIFLPIQAVGYYAIGGSLIGYLRALLGSSAQIFNPLASEFHSLRQGTQLTAAFFLGVKICAVITAPIVVTFVVLGREFIGLWMGAEFAGPSSEVLAVLAVAVFLAAPQYVFSSVLYGMSRHRIIALMRLAEAAANLVLSIVLVQAIGLVGVALGTAIPSAFMVVVVLPAIAARLVGTTPLEIYKQAYLRPLVAVTPFAIGAYWLRNAYPANGLAQFFAQVSLLLLVYAPCAFAVVLNAGERKLVLQPLRARLRFGR